MPLALPRTLSPSKVSSFTDCPLAFRFAIIDRLPEPPSPPAVKGTLVHAALEGLFWRHPAGPRTPRSGRWASWTAAWERAGDGPRVRRPRAEPRRAPRRSWPTPRYWSRNYFELEDPDAVRDVGVELGIEIDLAGMRLRGIIDRLDLTTTATWWSSTTRPGGPPRSASSGPG